mmetsp:Transcript_4225/g.26850  ORF Transcript_4225/g.26850 Transcript_4225/m.26850 type:complete len:114 (+) Transcript_4225:731-1072(+)
MKPAERGGHCGGVFSGLNIPQAFTRESTRLVGSVLFATLNPERIHHQWSPSFQFATVGQRASKCVLRYLPSIFDAASIAEGSVDAAPYPCADRPRSFHSDLVQQGQNFLFDAV